MRSKTRGRSGRSSQIQHQEGLQLLNLQKSHQMKKINKKKYRSKQSRKRQLNRSSLKRKLTLANLHGSTSTLIQGKIKNLSKSRKSNKRIRRTMILDKLLESKNRSKRRSCLNNKKTIRKKERARKKLKKTKSKINHGGSLVLGKIKRQKRRKSPLILRININNLDLNLQANAHRSILTSILM